MNTILFISLLLIAATALAFRFSKTRLAAPKTPRPIPDSRFDGLFAEQGAEEDKALAEEEAGLQREASRQRLLERAAEGDLTSLDNAHFEGNARCYKQVLLELVTQADGNPKVLQSIAKYIIDSRKLRSSSELSDAMIVLWSESPEQFSLAMLLHVAALADDVAVFNRAIVATLAQWRTGMVSAKELLNAIESAYWLVAGEVRTSGEGFLLKQAIADVRRELAAANRQPA